MVTIIITLAVDESYGLVKASRVLKECGVETRNISINTLYNTIRASFNDVEKLKCALNIKGFLSAEILSTAKCDNIKHALSQMSFNILPSAPQRIIGYKSFGEYTIVVQKTSKENTYLLRICNIKRFDVPLPPSACIFRIKDSADVDHVKSAASLIERIEEELKKLCSSSL